MIVIDTNIIVYLHITSERTAQAEQAFKKDPDWAAPLLWRNGFLNVLAGYLRRKTISIPEAQRIMGEALRVMEGSEIPASPMHVLELTALSTCTVYDCEFVALAQDLGVKLVTVDKKILAQFPETAIELGKFAGKN
jgi:predicted nucleic acid-binding protein